MAYNATLAARVRAILVDRPTLVEKKMFGGLGFIVHGNMCCGVHGDDLIVRCTAAETDALLSQPGAHVFDLSRRPMKGWLLVAPEGCADEAALADWVEQSFAFALTLPAK